VEHVWNSDRFRVRLDAKTGKAQSLALAPPRACEEL
jgi:hypothetical protein